MFTVIQSSPSAVLGGWAALACQGLDYYHDAPIHLHVSYRPRRQPADGRIVSYRPHLDVFERQWGGVTCRFVGVGVAVVDCLVSIVKQRHSWWVPDISGMSATDIRCLEILDLARTLLGLKWEDLAAEAAGRFSTRALKRLWRQSVHGVHSPPETHLRLIVRDLAKWETQVDFRDVDGRHLTSADLYDPVSKVALFYDGVHHLDRAQRDYDSRVTQQLALQGITAVRITAGQIRQPEELLEVLQALMERK